MLEAEEVKEENILLYFLTSHTISSLNSEIKCRSSFFDKIIFESWFISRYVSRK
jgi:hypothetical protein